MVVVAYVTAKLLGPPFFTIRRKVNLTSVVFLPMGTSWLPMHVGYYLFAILFLMFDVETVFLYPWAVVVSTYGVLALATIGFFMLVLVFGLAYAWRKGALEWK